MKKFFYSVFALATMLLATTSCSQEMDEASAPIMSGVTSFSVSLNGATGTRAYADGTTATKLHYEVYQNGQRVIDAETNISTTASVELPLLKGETYDIIFWAQAANGSIYDVSNLKEIKVTYDENTMANVEAYDAFYNALPSFKADSKTHTIELRRPFAQLNLGTSDWGEVKVDDGSDAVTDSKVVIKGLAKTFAPLTGIASGDETATFHLNTIPDGNFNFTIDDKTYKYLSMNYLLVPGAKDPQGLLPYQEETADSQGKANVDITFTLNRGTKELFEIEVPNAPVQRNWRTNVVGQLLTSTSFDVIIQPGIDGNYGTNALLEEVLSKGGEFTLASDVTLAEAITVPEGVEAKINLNGKTLTVVGDENAIVVGGQLNVTNGTVISSETAGMYAFKVNSGATLNIESDATVKAQGEAASAIYMKGGVLNVNGVVESKGTNVAAIFYYGSGVADVNVDGTIKSDYYALVSYQGTTNVFVSEDSEMGKIMLGSAGTMNLTYAGETQPTVENDGTAVTLNVKKVGETQYKGIYTVDAAKKEYNVTSAEGVLNLHKLMADISTGEGNGATINLTADVDLENQPFTPIDKMWVTFNGNNHTIKNLNVTGENDWAGRSGFFTYLGGGTISNLTLENVTSTGRQAGIFAGQQEGGKIENCTIAGNNTIEWSTTTGVDNITGNGIGAFVGVSVSYGSGNEISGTIAEGATVSLKPGEMTSAWTVNNKYFGGLWESTNLTVVTPTLNITDNGTVGYIVSSDGELQAAIRSLQASGATITLADGTYSQDIKLTVDNFGTGDKGDLIFKAAEGAEPIIAGTVTLGYREQNVGAAMWNGNVTFEGITFDHANVENHSIDVGDVTSLTLKNCKIIGDGEYGISSARGNSTGASRIEHCTFENAGMQLLGNFATNLVINTCTFKESCINVQAGSQPGVTVETCNFTNTLTSDYENESFYVIRAAQNNAAGVPLTIKDCTISIDSELSEIEDEQSKWGVIWNRGTSVAITVQNVAVTMSEAALKQTELLVTKTAGGAINATDLTVNGKEYIAEGVLKNNEGEYEIYKAAGLSYFSGKKVEGTINLVADIDMKNETFKTMLVTYSKELTLNGNNKNIKNIKLEDAGHNGNVGCTSLFQTDDNAKLTVNNLSVSDVTIETGATRAAVICAYNNAVLTLNNVDVTKANLTGEKNSAVLVGYTVKPVNIEGCDVTDSSVTTTGISSSTNSLYPAAAYVSRVNTATAVVTIKNSTNTTNLPAIGEIMNGGSATVDGTPFNN